MDSLYHFLHMGGHGFYVWTAYGAAFILLIAQWMIPWRRFKTYLHKLNAHNESHS